MHKFQRPIFFTILLFSLCLSYSQIVINEASNKNGSILMDEDGEYDSWVELLNNGASDINLLNYAISDDSLVLDKWLFPSLSIAPGEFMIIFASGKDRKPDTIVNHWEQPVNDTAIWKFFVPSSPQPGWTLPGYNDLSWGSSKVSIGYGDDDDSLIVPDGTRTVYMRYEFSLSDTSKIADVLLSMDYDDGFVAYLNGNVIALNGFADGFPPFNEFSSIDHEAAMYAGGYPENYLIEETIIDDLLVEGINVLAIEVHNVTAASSDLTARSFLSFGIKDATVFWSEALPFWFPYSISSGNLHTNFSINNSGETLYLTNSWGILEDSLFVYVADPDYSFGCEFDGSDTRGIFTVPTPGSTNMSPFYTDYIDGIAGFNLDAGFYTGTQTIELTIPPGSEVHFTLNGAMPTLADPIYSAPIIINSTAVIKARTFDPLAIKLPGQTETNTYFIDENITVPVISITTDENNLYGAEGIFDNWWTDWKKPGYIEYFDSLQFNAFEQHSGLKVDGGAGGSRSLPQKSMRIELDHNAYGDGTLNYPLIKRKWFVENYETFYLRNGSNMSNVLTYKDAFMVRTTEDTYNEHMAYDPVVVFINGEYWGYYELRNKLDEGHFYNAKGINKDSLDLLTLSYWYGLVLRTLSGSDEDFIEMRNYLGNYPTPEDPDFYFIADSILDLKNFTDYIIAETWMANYDWPYNNIKAWRDRGGDNKWKYAVIDVELGLGIGGWSDVNSNLIGGLFYSQEYIEPLATLLQNPIYHDYFVNRYADLMNSTFLPERTLAMEDSMYLEVEAELPRQLELWGYGPVENQLDEFNNYRNALRNDFLIRSDKVRNHIKDDFGLDGEVNITLECSPPGSGRIKISTLTIFDLPWTGIYFNGVPVQITAEPNTGYTFSYWETNPFIDDTTLNSFISNITVNETFVAVFEGAPAAELITVSEINFDPEPTINSGNWIELWNHGFADVNISGWKIQDGNPLHNYTIPEATILSANNYYVFAVDTILFKTQHPEITNMTGPLGFGLNNSEETIRVYDIQNNLKIEFTYLDDLPWPVGADGEGRTMELSNPLIDLNNAVNWFDGCIGGSAGEAYAPCMEAIIFSEINYNSGADYESDDWIELRNISAAPVNIGGWKFMDDSVGFTHEFIIPDDRILEPMENWVLAQTGSKFNALYPEVINYDSSFNFNLDDNGEWIRMYDENGILALSVNYNDISPWPLAPDGGGYTLELLDSMGIMNSGNNWIYGCPGGSPGAYVMLPCIDTLINTTDDIINENMLQFSVYPNPATDYINIYLDIPYSQKLTIDLVAINGQSSTVLFDGLVSAGVSAKLIDLKVVNSGVYLIKINSDDGRMIQKLIKL